ncbi:hypothetical protein TRFO_18239 [Tritrichomonas foetus]|uniref:Uncharacterized protein n=1 Tax=Tritrichomonas foetus TaxID=1144522 RepID=A0A1J4KM86_9EUKA|nr:hypothetical protein TRFO_18239 [Tritrichomonas foetus]|eukprot:OHT12048.1 hypothetical protein TRFO_18239 [Tritrichomonas foetus]
MIKHIPTKSPVSSSSPVDTDTIMLKSSFHQLPTKIIEFSQTFHSSAPSHVTPGKITPSPTISPTFTNQKVDKEETLFISLNDTNTIKNDNSFDFIEDNTKEHHDTTKYHKKERNDRENIADISKLSHQGDKMKIIRNQKNENDEIENHDEKYLIKENNIIKENQNDNVNQQIEEERKMKNQKVKKKI